MTMADKLDFSGKVVVVTGGGKGVGRGISQCFLAAGAELVAFDPMEDERLPTALDGLLVGGGFPEVYAAALAANT